MPTLVSDTTEYALPTLAPGAPAHLEHLFEELSESFELDAPGTSLRLLKETFHYLVNLFADFIEAVSSVFGDIEFADQYSENTEKSIEAIRKGLAFLSKDAPQELPEVRALVDVFYDGSGSKKFARLLGIGGKPRRGMMPLADFIKARAPARKKVPKELKRYMPLLKEWVESASYLFVVGGIELERTDQEGMQKIRLRLGKQSLESGKRLKVSNCPLCIPEKEISVPQSLYEQPVYFFVPQKTPKFLLTILDDLDEAMTKADPVAGCLELSHALEFLIRYFAGVTSKVCEELDILPEESREFIDNSESIAASENLLNLCLERLKSKPDALAAKSLISIFYRRNEYFEFLPRWHTEVLSLSGQLSAWCQLEPGYGELEDPEVCRIEFETQVLTLKEWLGSMGAYLQSSEHFFNDVSSQGSVEFSLRIGDGFVEVGEPGYLLWLNYPRPAVEVVPVESGEARPPLIATPTQIPEGAPKVLERILTRMDIHLRLGEPIESCLALRDAVDYLTRYFAGVAVAGFKRLGTLPKQAEHMAKASLSVRECEKLLLLALRSFEGECEDELCSAIRDVFYYVDDFSQKEKPTGAHSRLLTSDADPSSKTLYIAEFCSLQPGEGALSHPARAKREIERFLPPLEDWLATAEPFFKLCRHFEEPPGKDGKTELVIEYNDIYLELVAPDYIFYIVPGADKVPDLEAPELPPLESVQGQELLEQAARRKSPQEAARDRPFIVHRVDLIGERENSRGVMCQAGYIVLTNAGGGTLSGMTVSTAPDALEVEPKRFRGNKVQLSYWVDPDELPDTHEVFIELKTAHEVRSISVYEMIGQARAKPVSTTEGFLKMAFPAAAWLLAFWGIFLGVSHHLHTHFVREVGPKYEMFKLFQDAPEALFEVTIYTHLVGYLYLWTAGIVPICVGWIFRKMPPSTQELLEGRRRTLMVLPTLIVLLSLVTPLFENHFTQDADFPAMHLRSDFLYFIGLNLLSTCYQEFSLTEKIDDIIINKDLRRWLAPTLGWFAFITIILLGVAG